MSARSNTCRWAVISLLLVITCNRAFAAKTLYVDDDGPADFNNIQAGIDASVDGDTVLVAPGTYTGDGNRDIDFKGKAITVRSEYGPETCIIDCKGSPEEPHRGFHFHSGEDANSVLQGFTITKGHTRYNGGGIYCDASSPRIENCLVTANTASSGGGIACVHANSVIANCIISGNRTSGSGGGIRCEGIFTIVFINCTIYENRVGGNGAGGGISFRSRHENIGILRNCILWGNTAKACDQIEQELGGILGEMRLKLDYCIVQNNPNAICAPRSIEGSWIQKEPYFTNQGYWDPNGTPDNPNDDYWVDGDYHLKSQAGRWDSNNQSWVIDDVTSPGIDAGDPNSTIGLEPFPNGGRINIGAYGGTTEASKSYFGEPLCETIIAGDINGDCRVDFADFAIMASHWLEER